MFQNNVKSGARISAGPKDEQRCSDLVKCSGSGLGGRQPLVCFRKGAADIDSSPIRQH